MPIARTPFVALASFAALTLAISCASSGESTPPRATTSLTWFRDVEPIVQTQCNGCHYEGGVGPVVFVDSTVGRLASAMADRVQSGTMPPWPPGPKSKPMQGARVLSATEVRTIVEWANGGAPRGDPADHRTREPRQTFAPGRPYDFKAVMSEGYLRPPADSNLTDEVRCFVLDLGSKDNQWVTAIDWIPGHAEAIHHIGGLAVSTAGAAVARARYGDVVAGGDGRPGYECAGSFGENVQPVAGFSASGAGRDTGTMMPAGTGIFVPAGASIILSMHYIVGSIREPDRSGVALWFAKGEDRKKLRPMVQYTFGGPSELPCPSGVSSDPNDRCSREYGIAQVKSQAPEKTRAVNDYLLSHCGTSLQKYYAQLPFAPADPAHFIIPTDCDDTFPYDGVIRVVHAHMHTRGFASRISIQTGDGAWDPILDVPRYQWTWEGAYLLRDGVAVKAGQKLHLSCAYDNGTANQWSNVTHQPGHDGPAAPPLEPPHYVVAGPERGDDMCAAFLTVERTPYKLMTWADPCHEGQAIYDDVCTDKGINLLAGACEGDLEKYAVFLLETQPKKVNTVWCGPKGPGAAVGATCDLLNNCTLGCGAVKGFSGSGVSETCVNQCKANVYAYGKDAGKPLKKESPGGAWIFDALHRCAQSSCASKTTWQDYLNCSIAACSEEVQDCYKK